MKILIFFVLFLLLSQPALPCGPEPLSGREVSTGKLTEISPINKPMTVVLFLSSQCPCSIAHERILKELATQYSQVQFIGVVSNPDETDEGIQKHFKESQLPFPIIRDEASALANRFGALKTPHAFILNAQGKYLYRGGVSTSRNPAHSTRAHLRLAIEEILQGKTPTVADTRSLGCVIRR